MDKLLQVVRRILERSINFFIVRVWPVLVQLLIFWFWSTIYALAAIWTGWGVATERIALEWVRRMAPTPIPTPIVEALFPFAKVGAFFQIVFGWVFWALLTADILNRIVHGLTGQWVAF